MIIDSLITLGTSRFGVELSEEAALERCEREGVDVTLAAIAHPVDHDFVRANEELAACVERSAGRLMGLCRVDPWDGQGGLDLLQRSVRSLSHRGLVLQRPTLGPLCPPSRGTGHPRHCRVRIPLAQRADAGR